MIITGIAPSPKRLRERSYLPSGELIYLAREALSKYQATHLVTSLSIGWEQALAKAALELEIPFTAVIPFPGHEMEWKQDAREVYQKLIRHAEKVHIISSHCTPTALADCLRWQTEQSDMLLTLWDYVFSGTTYETMGYALQEKKTVVNLWQDWEHLIQIRKPYRSNMVPHIKGGARIFDDRHQPGLNWKIQ